jgi:hypothetical protein
METAETLKALASGAVGAFTLTLLHQSLRRMTPEAPRLDQAGMKAISKALTAMGQQPPVGAALREAALAGDLAANATYYSLVAKGNADDALLRGLALGLGAGLGAVMLAPKGSADRAGARSQMMTVALYVAGGLAAGAAYQVFERA